MKRNFEASSTSKGLSLPWVFLLILITFFAALQLSYVGSPFPSAGLDIIAFSAPTSASTTTFIPCQAALSYFTRESLVEAIQEALYFHVRGGNLKSIQHLKDRSIDGTLEKLALQFIPDEEKEKPTKEVTAYLRQYYDSHFDSRGGYGRPLPGGNAVKKITKCFMEQRDGSM
jgi:hypothetical protein